MNTRIDVDKPHVPDVFDVLDDCHRDIVTHLQKLTDLVAAFAMASPDQAARNDARELVAFFSGPVREHNYDEERHVFPTLLACDDDEVRRMAEILSEDHAWIELSWLDIEPQLIDVADGRPPSDLQALSSSTHVLALILHEHMALEESLLYPELRNRLKATARRRISLRMGPRRLLRATQI